MGHAEDDVWTYQLSGIALPGLTAALIVVEPVVGRGLGCSPRRRCAGVPGARRASTTPGSAREISEKRIKCSERRCIYYIEVMDIEEPANVAFTPPSGADDPISIPILANQPPDIGPPPDPSADQLPPRLLV
ncbi:MAG: hypothetical protein ACI9MR_002758 [Myxococcota bacterium]|jgi:hypothetical protein